MKMKHPIVFLLSLFIISLSLSAQESKDKKVFLDSLWKETSEGTHKYYSIIYDYYSSQNSYKVSNYYKSGALQMEGYTNNKESLSKVGDYIYYFENGNKKSKYHYNDESIPTGKYYTWYENGSPELEGAYLKNRSDEVTIIHYWNENHDQTVVNGNGYLKGRDFDGEGNVKSGVKDGLWKIKSKNSKEKITEIYDLGKFISGARIDENNVVTNYTEFEKKPIPRRGMNDFYGYISKNFRYTKASIKEHIKGKIIITFIVDADGKIIEPTIVQSLGYGLDEEAIRVLESYGKWIPGEQRGAKVRCLFSIPITLSGQN